MPDEYEPPAPEHSPADLAPTNLTTQLIGGGVSLTWDPPAEETGSITGYAILRAVGEAELTVLVADTDSKATSYTDATATEKGSTYAYQVKALRDGEESEASNRAEAQVPHDPADLAPTNLTAQLIDGGKVSLTWDPPAEDVNSVTQYKVLRTGQAPTRSVRTASTATDYTDSATDSGERYTYVVFALRDGEQSQGSNEVEVQIPHDPADLAPTGLTARLVDGGVSLDWDEPAADAASVTGYQVSRRWSPPDVDNVVVDTLFYADATAATWDDTALPRAGVSYTYKVRAVRDGERSGWSNEAQVDVPGDAVVGGGTTVAPPEEPIVALPGRVTSKPTIDGNPMVGETLTAGTGGIMDDDGITNAVYSYQWVRIDGRNVETDISGATSPTYTLVEADSGNRIKVTVSFTDDANNPESRTSDPVGPVDWEEIWSGNLTVGDFSDGSGRVGFVSNDGSLDDRDFTLEGTEYTINAVALHSGTSLALSLVDGEFGNLESVLVLEVDGVQFPFADSQYFVALDSYIWFQNLPNWSVNDTVSLRILRMPEPEITLTFVPAGFDRRVPEEVGTVPVGLRAETAGSVQPSEDFEVVVLADVGTATVGQDFEGLPRAYTLRAADFELESGVYVLTDTHDLKIIDDDISEEVEQLIFTIDTDALPDHVSVPSGNASGRLAIEDSDRTTISIVPPGPAEEGEDIFVTLRLDKPIGFDLIVSIAFFPGTALYGSDFVSNAFAVTFNEGDTEATVRISTVEEGLEEDDETFTLRLLDSGLHRLIDLPSETDIVLTILDDDESPVVLTPSSLKTPDHSTKIITLRATDGDGDDLTWSITGGTDQGLFNLTGDGALSFRSRQSYDSPGDSNRDRFYHVDVRVTDGDNPVDHQLTIELVHDVSVDDVTRTTAEVTVYALPGNEGETMYLQYGASHTWSPTQQRTVTDGTAVFRLGGLDAGTRYRVRASLDRKPLRPGDWQRDEFQTEISLLYGPEWLSARPTGNDGYRLTWTDPNELLPEGVPELTGYRIVRMDLSGRQPRVTLAGNAQGAEFTDPGPFVSGQTYFYHIRAVNRDGPSYQGAWARVTPQASDGFTATAPGAPRNLRYDRDAPDGRVALRWDAPEDGTATGYVVTVTLSGDARPDGGYRQVELGITGSNTYTHYLTREDFPDEGYIQRTYRVYAVNDLGLRSWPARARVPFVGPDCDGCSDSFIRPPP